MGSFFKMEIFIFLAIGFICAALVRKWQVKEDSQTAFRNSEMRLERARISARVMNEAYATGRLNLLESIYTKELYRQEITTAERLKRFDMYRPANKPKWYLKIVELIFSLLTIGK